MAMRGVGHTGVRKSHTGGRRTHEMAGDKLLLGEIFFLLSIQMFATKEGPADRIYVCARAHIVTQEEEKREIRAS